MRIEVYSAHQGGRYWRRLLEEWRGAGHTVEENFAFGDDTYRRKRGRLARMGLRFHAYVVFPALAWLRLCRKSREGTVRILITSPFFLPAIGAWTRRLCRRASPLINLTNDVFPDGLVQAGMISPNGTVARVLGRLSRMAIREADAVIYLGEQLRFRAESRYGPSKCAKVIPVGADAKFIRRTLPELERTEPLRILYSGVMGHMHDVATIADLCRQGLPKGVELTFHSSGVGYDELERTLRGGSMEMRVSLQGPLSDEAWRRVMNDHAIGLVTLKSGAEHVSMPSKTYSILAAGQAVLAVAPEKSDLAALIREHRCGWVVAPGDTHHLQALLSNLAGHPEDVHEKRIEAFRAGHRLFDVASISKEYLSLFEQLLQGSGMAMHTSAQAARVDNSER